MSIGFFTMTVVDCFILPTICVFNRDGRKLVGLMWLSGGFGLSFGQSQ